MGKIAVSFALAGLAVGLFLGFNPAAHKRLVRFWDTNIASQANAKTGASLSLRQLDLKVTRLFRSSPRADVTTKSEPGSSRIWVQISAAWQAFWQAIERIWLSLLVKLHSTVA